MAPLDDSSTVSRLTLSAQTRAIKIVISTMIIDRKNQFSKAIPAPKKRHFRLRTDKLGLAPFYQNSLTCFSVTLGFSFAMQMPTLTQSYFSRSATITFGFQRSPVLIIVSIISGYVSPPALHEAAKSSPRHKFGLGLASIK